MQSVLTRGYALRAIVVMNKKETVKQRHFMLCRFTARQSEPVGTCEKQMKCSFSLSIPYVRTNFSSEKLSCTRPTSEGICFAKQSEQWTTSPRSVNEVKRTNFSSEKLSYTRPTSEGICFAKQSEQWLTKPLLSQARLARACLAVNLHSIKCF